MATSETTQVSYDILRLNDYPIVTRRVTIAAGADLAPGAVLGLITASGKYALSASAAGNGSQTPKAILMTAAAAATADADAIVYLSGTFASDLLTFGAGHTAATVEAAFRAAQAPLFTAPRAV